MKTKKMILAALFLALGLALPSLTLQLKTLGNMLLPMHFPVLLCGFICGPLYGLLVGFITPLLRSVLFGMPPMMPIALSMAFELAVYGLVTGLMHLVLPKNGLRSIYIALITAMVSGRLVWGLVRLFLATSGGGAAFTLPMFLGGALFTAIPGIVLQLILIPLILRLLQKAKVIEV